MLAMLRVAWQGNLYQLSAVQGLKGNPPSETPANFKEWCPGEKGVPVQHGPRTAKSALQLLHALHEVAVLGQAGNSTQSIPRGEGLCHLPASPKALRQTSAGTAQGTSTGLPSAGNVCYSKDWIFN